ncbi:MAG TPA: CPBP family intramembrane glutamic endopeptidase [Terriglobales bacterium]|nr:CPBP family intramembrane glutamic endopeptidase [Terriglobales bacterium]
MEDTPHVPLPEGNPIEPTAPTAPEPLPVPPQPSLLRRIFKGPNGIRAGWRLLIYVAIVAALLAVIHLLRGHHHESKQTLEKPGPTIIGEWLGFAVFAFAAWVMSRIEKQPWSNYGLPPRKAFRSNFWIGAFFGFVALSCVMGCLRLAHCYYIDSVALHGLEVWKFAGLWLLAFLGVGFAEEFVARGYLQFTLASGMKFWPAAVLTAALFTFGHVKNDGETILGLTDVFLFGMLACFMWWRTGDLWLAAGFHAFWDWGLSFFYSVPDSGMSAMGHLFNIRVQGPAWLSGGSAGPEGSVINIIFDVLYFVIIALAFPRRQFAGWTRPPKENIGPEQVSVVAG